MDYIEVHLTKDALERAIFFSIIFVLLILAVISYKKSPDFCPEIRCNETPIIQVAEIPAAQTTASEKKEESKIFYVDIQNMHFAPRNLIITNGSTVVFQNKEPGTAHKLYEVTRLFITPKLNPSDKFNFTFTTLGNYTVWSTTGLEENMKMKIEVLP